MKKPAILHKLYRNYIGMKYPGTRIVHSSNGMKYILCPSNSTVEKNILLHGIYEPEETHLMNTIIKKGMVIIDVGAHIGYYSCLFGKLVGEQGIVYAIEPNPISYGYLRANVLLNKVKNVRCVEKALSSKYNISYYLNLRNLAWTIYEKDKVSEIIVEGTPAESFMKPDFIKVDVDGGEIECLKILIPILKQNTMIMIEIAEENKKGIEEMGFVITPIKGSDRNYLLYFDLKNSSACL